MEQTFNKGDIVKHPSIEKELIVLRYLDNFNEAVLDYLLSDTIKDEPYEVSTIVLCKWDNNGKEKKEKFEQDTLTLIK
ncbi:MAG TPA: hypothetical protein VGP43_06965 [Chitinophagaceae bacterium]|nr:hypothetical protein [Chitinophagaceae bacterium]